MAARLGELDWSVGLGMGARAVIEFDEGEVVAYGELRIHPDEQSEPRYEITTAQPGLVLPGDNTLVIDLESSSTDRNGVRYDSLSAGGYTSGVDIWLGNTLGDPDYRLQGDWLINEDSGDPEGNGHCAVGSTYRVLLGDRVVRVTLVGGAIVTGGGGGDVTGGENVGTGTGEVYSTLSSGLMQFRRLLSSSIVIATVGDDVTLEVTTGQGTITTGQSVGDAEPGDPTNVPVDVYSGVSGTNNEILDFRRIISDDRSITVSELNDKVNLRGSVGTITAGANYAPDSPPAQIGDVYSRVSGNLLLFRPITSAGGTITIEEQTDGTKEWLNVESVASGGTVTDGANLGTGLGFFVNVNPATTMNFKTIASPSGTISISSPGQEVNLDVDDKVVMSAVNLGGGAGEIWNGNSPASNELPLRTIASTPTVSVSVVGDTIELDAAVGSGDITNAANKPDPDGNGQPRLFHSKVGSILNFRSLAAASPIVIAERADDVLISSTAIVGGANIGGTPSEGEVYAGPNNFSLEFRRLRSSDGTIQISQGTDLDLSAPADGTVKTGSNLGLGSDVLHDASSTAENLAFRRLRSPSGSISIAISADTNEVEFEGATGTVTGGLNQGAGSGTIFIGTQALQTMLFRSLESSDFALAIVNTGNDTIDFKVNPSGNLVAGAINAGGGAEVYDSLTGIVDNDLTFRTLRSSDASISFTQDSTTIDMRATGGGPTVINDGWTNVKYPPTGYTAAKGDGVTDDTAAIQNMIAGVNSRNLGVLFFPPGIYNIREHSDANTGLRFEEGYIPYRIEGCGNSQLPKDNPAGDFWAQNPCYLRWVGAPGVGKTIVDCAASGIIWNGLAIMGASESDQPDTEWAGTGMRLYRPAGAPIGTGKTHFVNIRMESVTNGFKIEDSLNVDNILWSWVMFRNYHYGFNINNNQSIANTITHLKDLGCRTAIFYTHTNGGGNWNIGTIDCVSGNVTVWHTEAGGAGNGNWFCDMLHCDGNTANLKWIYDSGTGGDRAYYIRGAVISGSVPYANRHSIEVDRLGDAGASTVVHLSNCRLNSRLDETVVIKGRDDHPAGVHYSGIVMHDCDAAPLTVLDPVNCQKCAYQGDLNTTFESAWPTRQEGILNP